MAEYTRVCVVCQQEFTVYRTDRIQKCCSQACRGVYLRKPLPQCVCTYCGEVFNGKRKRLNKYCSMECWNNWQQDNSGVKSIHWQGGRVYVNGYVKIWVEADTYELEYRVVMERELGRKLNFNEVVHHIDGNKLNNNINNLELTNHSEHRKRHIKYFRDNTHKQCGYCKQIKSRECFGPSNTPKGDPSKGWCRGCCNEYNRIIRHE